MKIIKPSVELIAYTQWAHAPEGHAERENPDNDMARVIERAGRISWKSEDKMEPGSASGFITRVVNIKKDESIAEHASVTLLFVTDRYVTHQLVRHRIGAYTQESTHYINYTKAEKGGEISVCKPMAMEYGTPEFTEWQELMEHSERVYFNLCKKMKHYEARYALPGALKTEIVVTYNLRIWRYVLGLRTTPNNTPEIVSIMKQAGYILHDLCPEMFEPWARPEI